MRQCQWEYDAVKSATKPLSNRDRVVAYYRAQGPLRTLLKAVSVVKYRVRTFLAAKIASSRLRLQIQTFPAERQQQSVQREPRFGDGSLLASGTTDSAPKRCHTEVLDLQPGDLVEVKSAREILETLDLRGKNKGLEFLPEMRRFCGQRLRVLKRVTTIKTEDGREVRKLKNTVLLWAAVCEGQGARCDRACFFFWREVWLRRIPESIEDRHEVPAYDWPAGPGCSVEGHRSFGKQGQRTEHGTPNLRPGELVEVRSEQEIQATLDSWGKCRGLLFMPEMWRYCGRRFRVLKRLERAKLETTSEKRLFRGTVLLKGAICDGLERLGCDRMCFFCWREEWLKRVEETQ